jgi:hypothetical protein
MLHAFLIPGMFKLGESTVPHIPEKENGEIGGINTSIHIHFLLADLCQHVYRSKYVDISEPY